MEISYFGTTQVVAVKSHRILKNVHQSSNSSKKLDIDWIPLLSLYWKIITTDCSFAIVSELLGSRSKIHAINNASKCINPLKSFLIYSFDRFYLVANNGIRFHLRLIYDLLSRNINTNYCCVVPGKEMAP